VAPVALAVQAAGTDAGVEVVAGAGDGLQDVEGVQVQRQSGL
jgi:hypothetical protein